MNILISIIYAPILFVCLKFFDIKIVCIYLFFISVIWFGFSIKKSIKQSLYPTLYILISIIGYFGNSFYILKSVPFIISLFFTALMLISYINKDSIILLFARKFSKKTICKEEEQYIHSSTIFWFILCLINSSIHFFILVYKDITFWALYSSIGWYFIFIVGGILQYLHRKFFFLKRVKSV